MREGLHKIVSSEQTIVAISTAFGRSALGMVRISGKDTVHILKSFFRKSGSSLIQDHQAVVGVWLNDSGELIDEVVVTYFKSPHSYTGEDVAEISGHGNPVTLECIVQCARSAGARLAEPGEFTLRAVSHGKMDLIQAEAVRQFIEAQTEHQARVALRQIEGSISKRLRPVKESLIDLIAMLEAGIDFAEDDIDVPENSAITERAGRIAAELEVLQRSFGYGRLLMQGLNIAILGKPNVGKSSLFNALVTTERSIVTDTPGTTRDVITETVDIAGVPLRFSDTAGIHETEERVEAIGIARSFESLATADLALIVVDGSAALDGNDHAILSRTSGLKRLVVINKCDLPAAVDPDTLTETAVLRISARTGEGLSELRDAIQAFILGNGTDLSDDSILTTVRQNEAVLRAIKATRDGIQSAEARVPHEMMLLHFYESLSALDELTGEVVTDDILGRIFSTFCVGK